MNPRSSFHDPSSLSPLQLADVEGSPRNCALPGLAVVCTTRPLFRSAVVCTSAAVRVTRMEEIRFARMTQIGRSQVLTRPCELLEWRQSRHHRHQYLGDGIQRCLHYQYTSVGASVALPTRSGEPWAHKSATYFRAPAAINGPRMGG